MKFASRMPHLPAVAVWGTLIALVQSGQAQTSASTSVKLPGNVSIAGASSRGSAFPYAPYFPVGEAGPTITSPTISTPVVPPTTRPTTSPTAFAPFDGLEPLQVVVPAINTTFSTVYSILSASYPNTTAR